MADTPWTKGPFEYRPRERRAIVSANGTYLAFLTQHKNSKADGLLFSAAPDMAEAHDENARILGYLVNELQGRIEAGKLESLNKCLKRSLAMSAKARGEQ